MFYAGTKVWRLWQELCQWQAFPEAHVQRAQAGRSFLLQDLQHRSEEWVRVQISPQVKLMEQQCKKQQPILPLSKLHLERRTKICYCRECEEIFTCKVEHQVWNFKDGPSSETSFVLPSNLNKNWFWTSKKKSYGCSKSYLVSNLICSVHRSTSWPTGKSSVMRRVSSVQLVERFLAPATSRRTWNTWRPTTMRCRRRVAARPVLEMTARKEKRGKRHRWNQSIRNWEVMC